MPSFRKARESLSKSKLRLFRRRRFKRQHGTSSSGPAVESPIIASTSDSLNLNGKGSDCTSVLISPSGIIAKVDAGVVEGRKVATPVKEVKKYIGNVKSLHLVEYDESDHHCHRTSTPVAWAEEADSVDNTADITVSLRANEIVAVESVADLGICHEGEEADVLHVAPRVKITKTAGSGEHPNFEYEEDCQNPPAIIPDFSDEERDAAHDAVHDADDIVVDLGGNKTLSVWSMGEGKFGEEGETVIETITCIEPLDEAREEYDQYPPTVIGTEEADRDSRTVNEKNNGEDTDDQYLPTITLIDSLEERGDAVDNAVAARGAKIATVGNITEVGIDDEGVNTGAPIMERRETADRVDFLNAGCEESTKCSPTTISEETGGTKEDENKNIDITCDDVDTDMSTADEEHAATDIKEDEHIECRQDDNTAKANTAGSIESGTAEDEEFEETRQFDIMSDAPNEVATATENEKKSNTADHIEINNGDDEQTSLPTPKMIDIAPPDNNENTILARRFNVGDHVQVVRKGHKRNGMCGIIEKQTKCYAFFKNDNTNETIRIMPCSLALVTCETSSTETPIESLPLHVESQSKVSSEAYVPSLPSKKPTDFAIRSSVKVVYEHSKYGGKEGIVQRHTAKYVVVVFKDKSLHKEVRISPKFLMKSACDLVSSTITTSFSTDSEFNDEQGRIQGGIDTAIPSMSAAKEAPALGFGKYPLEKIILRNPKKLACVETVFQKIWGEGNYLNLEMPLDPKDLDADLPLTQTVFGKAFELYHAKVKEDNSCGLSYSKSKKVIAHYVHANNLRAHEEMLADFGTLPPSKIWARRGHFLSPATKLKFNNEYGVKSITADDVVMIEDLGTVGCGFISEQYLEELLGNNTEARRTLGIQVRIFIPTKGVFKGMLMRKQGINSKIQLNESLRKVLPSRSDETSANGHIVIKRTFPSKDNFQGVGRLFQIPDDLRTNKIKSITKSFRDGLQKGTSCKLSPMYQRVLQGLGVPKDTLQQYIRQYQKNADDLCHTHVIGMSDPTNKFPPNSVFITGTVELDRLFVSRSPCMEAEDGRVVKVVRTKPNEMRDCEWEWLQSLTFGAIIFGNPRPGERPLPELIADGDLDGDLYFVLWHETLLSLIQPVDVTKGDLLAPTKDDTAKEKQYDPHWFDKTQRFISRIPCLHADIDQLIGMTYKASEAIEDIRDSDAVHFARAYKQALDAKKHGGPIFLPGHLWETVPEKLHKHLAE